MRLKAFILVLLVFTAVCRTQSKKILCLLGVGTETALKWNNILLTELAARGNELTIVTPVLWNAETEDNIEFIHLENGSKFLKKHSETEKPVSSVLQQSSLGTILDWYGQQMATCRGNLNSSGMSEVWNMASKENYSFDMIIFDLTYGPGCFLQLLDLFTGIPVVGITGSSLTSEILNVNQNSILNAAIDPFALSDFGRTMNYWTRIYNTLLYGFDYIYRQWVVNEVYEGLWSHYFHDKEKFVPKALNDLNKRLKIILANHHPALHTLSSLPYNVVPVPGLHIKTNRNTTFATYLSKFEKDFVDGIVLISLELEQLGELNVQVILEVVQTFSKYGFIWKVHKNMNLIQNKPKNLILEAKFENQEILDLFKADQRIKTVFTSPDILRIQESLFHGIPMITLTLTPEQGYLAQRLKEQGVAVNLQLSELSNLASILDSTLSNDTLKNTALQLQKSFASQQNPSLDTAVWWVEHLLENPEANDYLYTISKADFGFVARSSLDIILFFEILFVLFVINTILVYKQTTQNFEKFSRTKKNSRGKNELKAKKSKNEKKPKKSKLL